MSQNSENIAQIEAHRKEIDALDRRIVDLLNARARQSLAIRALKPGAGMNLYDPAREERIFEKIAAENGACARRGTCAPSTKRCSPSCAASPTPQAAARPLPAECQKGGSLRRACRAPKKGPAIVCDALATRFRAEWARDPGADLNLPCPTARPAPSCGRSPGSSRCASPRC